MFERWHLNRRWLRWAYRISRCSNVRHNAEIVPPLSVSRETDSFTNVFPSVLAPHHLCLTWVIMLTIHVPKMPLVFVFSSSAWATVHVAALWSCFPLIIFKWYLQQTIQPIRSTLIIALSPSKGRLLKNASSISQWVGASVSHKSTRLR